MPGTWSGPLAPISLPAGYGGIDLFDDGSGTLVEAGDGSGTGGPGNGYYPVSLVVAVWDSTTGADWAGATVKSSSAPFTYTQRFTGRVTDTEMINQSSVAINLDCPEPSVVALGVIGVTALVFFRRRK